MGFRGNTFILDYARAGFTYNKNIDNVKPAQFIYPSRNINLHSNGVSKRGGTSKINGTAVSGAPRLMAIYDYTLEDGTSFQMMATSDGKIYKNATSTIKTGLGTTKKTWFENFEDELYIANGNDIPQTWDGAAGATSNITNPATEWTGTNQPKYLIAHTRNTSKRMVGFGVASEPKSIWISAGGDGKEFVTGVVKLVAETNDGFGVVAAIEIGEEMVFFGRKQAFRLDDSSATTSNWGFKKAHWLGGAAHQRLVVKTPNDVIVMAEDGNIYSIAAVQEYGDYKISSISKPVWLDRFFMDFVDLTYIDDFHATYDPVLRCIDFNVVLSGDTQVSTALRFFIDRAVDEAWTIVDNQSASSGYNASCSMVVRTGVGTYKRYNGDYSGFVWELETANRNDDSAAYYAGIKTSNLNMGNPRVDKRFVALRVLMDPQGDYTLQYAWWVDGTAYTGGTISMADIGATLGSFVLDTDILGGGNIIDAPVFLGNVGRRLQIELYNSNANENFFISQAMIDFIMYGSKLA